MQFFIQKSLLAQNITFLLEFHVNTQTRPTWGFSSPMWTTTLQRSLNPCARSAWRKIRKWALWSSPLQLTMRTKVIHIAHRHLILHSASFVAFVFLFCLYLNFFWQPTDIFDRYGVGGVEKRNCEIYLGEKFASFCAELVSKSLRWMWE